MFSPGRVRVVHVEGHEIDIEDEFASIRLHGVLESSSDAEETPGPDHGCNHDYDHGDADAHPGDVFFATIDSDKEEENSDRGSEEVSREKLTCAHNLDLKPLWPFSGVNLNIDIPTCRNSL